ncbi:amidohydrolase/deacetylase family metallohydrolase [Paenibacillus kobensis]|uniref:amidohydrolase/deacetylase family metallohydrolase n=1 Tax=Paenibacillus kobensis TaxID=59841 RepID=UPI000FDC69FB|nr:amidohydrolase/deacetylase family metallohydrolase [Paenibacillus kobensis]
MNARIILLNVVLIGNTHPVDIVIEDGIIAGWTNADEAARDAYHDLDDARVIDCTGWYASSGWIDLHVHAMSELQPYGDEIDEIGVRQGVTTIVDAGSCGADRIGALAASRELAMTNVFALLNISRVGLARVDELTNLEWIDQALAVESAVQYGDFIVGLKARMSGSVVGDNGLEPLRIARSIADDTGLPIMVHVGSAPPAISDIVPMLAERDMITHCLNGKKNRLFDENDQPVPQLIEALDRGVRLDVGHGTASFSFRTAEAAKRCGIPIHTISTDIYRGNRLNGPVHSLSHVLTKFLYLGYSLEEIIDSVTVRAAEWLRKPELARLSVGERANLTLFAVHDEPVELIDSEGDKRIGTKRIEAKGVVHHGHFIKC